MRIYTSIFQSPICVAGQQWGCSVYVWRWWWWRLEPFRARCFMSYTPSHGPSHTTRETLSIYYYCSSRHTFSHTFNILVPFTFNNRRIFSRIARIQFELSVIHIHPTVGWKGVDFTSWPAGQGVSCSSLNYILFGPKVRQEWPFLEPGRLTHFKFAWFSHA